MFITGETPQESLAVLKKARKNKIGFTVDILGETVVSEQGFDGVTHTQILAILDRYGSLDAANARAMQYAALARNASAASPFRNSADSASPRIM